MDNYTKKRLEELFERGETRRWTKVEYWPEADDHEAYWEIGVADPFSTFTGHSVRGNTLELALDEALHRFYGNIKPIPR